MCIYMVIPGICLFEFKLNKKKILSHASVILFLSFFSDTSRIFASLLSYYATVHTTQFIFPYIGEAEHSVPIMTWYSSRWLL